ncbi:Propionyl-CoA carboxylase beta chain [Alphaproteobacteria bacterium SO-S41]|nr:Propionyl-CoA carboxylase beta chain [Alphaproteobacteria bacterium SO-S41]
MTWQDEVDEIGRRKALVREMGGPDKIERQRAQGKLTVRERIAKLIDQDSLHEIGAIAGKATYDADGKLTALSPPSTVFGRAKIDGRTVVIQGDDFTVRGGAADGNIGQKQVMAEQMANELRLPIVRLLDGTGGGGSVKSLDVDARTYVPANPGWNYVVANMATVPVVSLLLGAVAGLGAARAVTSHYSVMVAGVSSLFAAGPPVVRRLGEDVDKETLGGSKIHARNGSVDDEVESEEEAFARARRFLSYLPSSVYGLPERIAPTDDPNRREEKLLSIVPRDRRKVYKMRHIIEAAVDTGSFFEIGKLNGRSAITGLARIDGWPVAVIANDPYFYGGGWTADASHKLIRFLDMAETFHLPVVNFVDNPGFVVGVAAETAGTIRHGSRALAAVYQATVPWCSILIRKCFGVAGAANANANRLHYRFAWPSGDWGSLPMEGGIEAAFRADLEKSDDPAALLKEIQGRMEQVRSPFRTADAFIIEEIVDPRDTRPMLVEFANLAAPLRKPGPSAFGMRP